MTQKADLIEFLSDEPNQTASRREIFDKLGIPSGSLSSLLWRLKKRGILDRPSRGIYTLQLMFRHFISALFYCHDEKVTYSATTFSDSRRSLFSHLVDALTEETEDLCSEAHDLEDHDELAVTQADYGYAVDEVEIADVDFSYIFPEIDVVEE